LPNLRFEDDGSLRLDGLPSTRGSERARTLLAQAIEGALNAMRRELGLPVRADYFFTTTNFKADAHFTALRCYVDVTSMLIKHLRQKSGSSLDQSQYHLR
jgi:hypothetical protein